MIVPVPLPLFASREHSKVHLNTLEAQAHRAYQNDHRSVMAFNDFQPGHAFRELLGIGAFDTLAAADSSGGATPAQHRCQHLQNILVVTVATN
jgi:hypothetical protein